VESFTPGVKNIEEIIDIFKSKSIRKIMMEMAMDSRNLLSTTNNV
jgi:hypothetical protein